MTETQTNAILDMINEVTPIYTPVRDTVLVNTPSQEEIDAANKRNGIITGIKTEQVQDEIPLSVIAVGPDCKYTKIGNKVLLKRNPGYPVVRLKGKNYLQIDEYSILGFVKGDIK